VVVSSYSHTGAKWKLQYLWITSHEKREVQNLVCRISLVKIIVRLWETNKNQFDI